MNSKQLALLIIIFLTSCGGGNSDSSVGSGSGTTETGTISGSISLADDVLLSARNSQYLNVQSPQGIRIYIDGDDSLYDDTDSNGEFSISNVPVGTTCVKATVQTQTNQTFGFRKCYELKTSGTEIGNIVLEESGSLSGIVTLENESEYEGILVYAAGSSFNAYTDSSGSFTVSDMPPGEYDVTILKDGYASRKYNSVIINPGEMTNLGSISLMASESCTDGGAVLAITSVSQNADTIDIGESTVLSIEACSSLDLGIEYTWYEESCGSSSSDVLGTESQFTFTSNDADGGYTKTFCVKAEIDSNNIEYALFDVNVRNNDYFEHLSRYESHILPEETLGMGMYGNFLYVLGIKNGSLATSSEDGNISYGEIEIIDISDPVNPEFIDNLEYNKGDNNFVSGLLVEGSKMFVQMCELDGTNIYMYDLVDDPANPMLLTTLTNEDISSDGDTDCIVDYVNTNNQGSMLFDGRYLYVPVGGDVNIIDLANPTNPSIVSTIQPITGSYRPLMAYYDDYLIIANEDNIVLDIWNIANRAAPTLTTTYEDGWNASGTEEGPQILFDDSGRIFVSHDSYDIDILDITTLPTITLVDKIEGVNQETCYGSCSAITTIQNVGAYTLIAPRSYSLISILELNSPNVKLGDVHSYVDYFSPTIFGILGDEEYVYVVHNDGVDIFILQ